VHWQPLVTQKLRLLLHPQIQSAGLKFNCEYLLNFRRIVTEFNKGKKGSMDKSADVQKAEELARLYGAWIAAYAKK
jgi:hypothetical protein